MSELKRCPCCNSEDIVTGDKNYSLGTDIYIRCKTCGLKLQIREEFGWEELFKRWNTRIPMQNIVERLEEFEEEATQLGVGGMFTDMLEIVKEEGGIDA